jgi:hypothetical protein
MIFLVDTLVVTINVDRIKEKHICFHCLVFSFED